jgi:small ligand-binding sensory domain FIST
MPFAAAVSQHPLATHAVGEVVGEVLDRLGDRPDAALVFVTAPFAGAFEDIASTIQALLRPGALVGASAASVIGGGREVEGVAAVSLFAMRFGPRRRFTSPVGATAVRVQAERRDDGWQIGAAGSSTFDGSTLVLLADPFSFPVEAFVDDLADRRPGLTVVGGLASSAAGPGGNRLVADGNVFADGAVGLLLPEGVGVTPVVSQGCRPVGEPLVVTKATGNLIEEIAGMPALDRLMAQADAATPEDRTRMARGLQLGLVIDERKTDFERGDFLIRAVLGADHARKAVAVGAEVEVGSTVQFQVRDAASADEDLRDLLVDAGGEAALVFTCTGRGTSLFSSPHHDAGVISQHLDGGPVAGMFCAGEIGPIGGRTFVHALSASALLLDDPF